VIELEFTLFIIILTHTIQKWLSYPSMCPPALWVKTYGIFHAREISKSRVPNKGGATRCSKKNGYIPEPN
jgi:hypothetical protein